ncbi:MAG: DNA polymerase III subunit delta [Cyclobacteriaceae bacterium]|nr:DNA polymerase III subunit delta [Cyclobacteriaceae bacterium]MCH8516457.1 DNA polymerase III subunit delta [Cyclobacteriaceae bacterium]
MAQTPEMVLRDMEAGKYAPFYFLQGEEPFYIDKIADYVEEHALDEASKGFNQMIMYGKDVELVDILNNAKRYPMMSERQVVIVKEAQDIPRFNTDESRQMLLSYLENMVETTILVFAHKYKKIDGKTKLAKAIDKHGILVTTKKLYENQIAKWIDDEVKAKGHTIHPKAAQMMVESIGANLERLSSELDKLYVNFAEPTQITDDFVQKYVGISKEYNAFELTKAIGMRDVLKAQKIIKYFAADPKGNPIIPIIAALFNYFSKILLIHSLGTKNKDVVAAKIKIHPFFAQEYIIAAQSYPPNKVVACIREIRNADLHSKGIESGSVDDMEILKLLVFKLMH